MAAETIARFKRMQGYEAVMFTGTDEHGQKVERSAEAAGKTPQEFTDTISAEFRTQFNGLKALIDLAAAAGIIGVVFDGKRVRVAVAKG